MSGGVALASPGVRRAFERDSLNVFFAEGFAPGVVNLASPAVRVLLERDSLNVFFADASVTGVTPDLDSPATAAGGSWRILPVEGVAGGDCASPTPDT
jgi:hypothetical protein